MIIGNIGKPEVPSMQSSKTQEARRIFLSARQSVFEDARLSKKWENYFDNDDCLGLTWSRLLLMVEELRSKKDFSKYTHKGLAMSQEILTGIWAQIVEVTQGRDRSEVLEECVGSRMAEEVDELMAPLERRIEVFFDKIEKRQQNNDPEEFAEIEFKDLRILVGFALNELEENTFVTFLSKTNKKRAFSKFKTRNFRLGVQLARSVWGDLSSNA